MQDDGTKTQTSDNYNHDLLSNAGIDMPNTIQYEPPKNKKFPALILIISIVILTILIVGVATVVLLNTDDNTGDSSFLELNTSQEQYVSALDTAAKFNNSMFIGDYDVASSITAEGYYIQTVVKSAEEVSKNFGNLDWSSCQISQDSADKVEVNIDEDSNIFRTVNINATCSTSDDKTLLDANYSLKQLNEDANSKWFIYDFYTSI